MLMRLVRYLASGVLACGIVTGCGSRSSDSVSVEQKSAAEASADSTKSSGAGGQPKSPESAAVDSARRAAAALEQQLAEIQSEVSGERWDAAEQKLAELRTSLPEAPAADVVEQLNSLEQLLAEHREAERRDRRAELLAAAKSAFDNGEWDQSLKQIDAVAALAPGESEREELNSLRTSIDKALKAKLQLSSWIKMLGSEASGEVKTAQAQLLEEPEAALPLVRQAIRQKDPITTRNALEFLRKLRKPDVSLPIVVSVLEDPGQHSSWEIAAKEIVRLEHPGAGPKLLQLILTSTDAGQRAATVKALAAVIDPPANTSMVLLPYLFEDGPDLEGMIHACTHAVQVHQLHDLLDWRSLVDTVSDTQAEQLSQLSERLNALQALSGDQHTTAMAAKELALALHFSSPQPLQGVTVLEATPTDPSIKSAALLDGVWNNIDPASMWWTPVSQQGYVIFDLGEKRTVTGIRIWNFNESAAGYRGWKDVEVYVSETPTALRPASRGKLLPAPGIADPVDYSQTISIDFAQGRYVKLICKEYLAQSSHAGLTEVQILGY